MIKAIFLDFGGTLFDYAPSNNQLLGAVAREYGVQIEDTDPLLSKAFQKQEEIILELYRNISPNLNDWLMEQITEEHWLKLSQHLLATVGITDQSAILDLHSRFNQRMFKFQFASETTTIIHQLKEQGYALGILSNLRNPDRMRTRHQMVKSNGIGDIWDAVVLSGDVGVDKPNSRIFSYAHSCLTQRGVEILPHEILMVGDSYIADVLGARNVGWKGVLLDSNMGKKFDCDIIPDIPALIPLLEKINNRAHLGNSKKKFGKK